MLITKFNRMIRSRVLWTIIAAIVCVCFVGAYSKTGGCITEDMNERDAVGYLYGKPVSPAEFERAQFYALGMRREGEISSSPQAIRNLTWKRIVALREAEALGLSASDEEVGEAIRQIPDFSRNGEFNEALYRYIVQSQMRVTVPLFEEYMRQELALQKLGRILESSVWTAPHELHRRLQRLTDSFTVRYAVFDLSNLVQNVSVTLSDAEKIYQENPSFFRQPERISVRYVEFPISNYLADVTVDNAEIQLHYTNNLADYSVLDTNREALPRPLEEVRDQIARTLAWKKAASRARTAGLHIVSDLASDRVPAPQFEDVAAARSLAIRTSAFFATNELVAGLHVGFDFNRNAFALDTQDVEHSFSDPVVGDTAVYVLAPHQRVASHVPPFGDVTNRALNVARRMAEQKAFETKCGEVRTAVDSRLRAGKDFGDAVAAFHPSVVTTVTFTAYSAVSGEMEHFDVLLPRIVTLDKGELSDVMPVRGSAILALVLDRQAGDAQAIDMVKGQFLQTINRYRSAVLLNAWQDHALTNANFRDLQAVRVEEPDSADRDESAPPPKSPASKRRL